MFKINVQHQKIIKTAMIENGMEPGLWYWLPQILSIPHWEQWWACTQHKPFEKIYWFPRHTSLFPWGLESLFHSTETCTPHWKFSRTWHWHILPTRPYHSQYIFAVTLFSPFEDTSTTNIYGSGEATHQWGEPMQSYHIFKHCCYNNQSQVSWPQHPPIHDHTKQYTLSVNIIIIGKVNTCYN